MLLARVADSLYWVSRYLERAEHHARVLDVALDFGLGQPSDGGHRVLDRLHGVLGGQPGAEEDYEGALFDADDRNSVVACVVAARENARQVREEISSDMWEQVNALFLRVRQMQGESSRGARTHFVSKAVIDGIHLFHGITDSTMGRGEGWQYLQLGRFLERATITAALIDSFLTDPSDGAHGRAALDQSELSALLRACSALEAYCRHYTADIRAERVAEFLLLNHDFPRSIRFAARCVEGSLLSIGQHSGRKPGGRAERLAGRLHASLEYGQVDEILNDNPHAYLVGIERQCAQIHAAVSQTYLTYAIDAALSA